VTGLDDVLHARAVTPTFQPVVDLDDSATVAFEALARGPAGTALAAPDALFGAARAERKVVELDWLCRDQALASARRAQFRHPLSLLINVEPEGLGGPAGGDATSWSEMGDLRCYTELTERALASSPADLLRAADRVREQDWGIALDDIGAHPASLALMPLLQPDILKIDMALVRRAADLQVARVLHAVLEQAQYTGATVIAEGVETEEQLDRVRSWGVRYGQGFLLGRPQPLPEPLVFPSAPVPLVPRVDDRGLSASAFAVVTGAYRTRRVSRGAVRELIGQLLCQAETTSPEPCCCSRCPIRTCSTTS